MGIIVEQKPNIVAPPKIPLGINLNCAIDPINFNLTKSLEVLKKANEYNFPGIKEEEPILLPTKWAEYEAPLMKATGLSQECLEDIIKNEGVKLRTYRCKANCRTIGIGHNIDADPNYKYGNKITKEQSFELFKQDLVEAGENLKKLTEDKPLTPGQKDALTDLIFNVGSKKLENSKLITLIKEGKFDEATKQFDYGRAGGKQIPALKIRRIEELAKFSKGSHFESVVDSMKTLQKSAVDVYDEKISKCKKETLKRMYNKIKSEIIKKTNLLISKVIEEMNSH